MREIKFRAWYSPGMAHPQKGVMNYSCAEGFENSGEALSVFQSDLLALGSGSVNIMQFTGLRDKNGKEIYEGDLLGGTYVFSEVGWCEACGGWQCFYDYHEEKVCHCCDGNFLWRELIDDQSKVEVIGNIHENPELPEAP